MNQGGGGCRLPDITFYQTKEVILMLKGIGASDGIGIGRVMMIAEQSLEYTPREISDVEA